MDTSSKINIIVPKSWNELSQAELKYLFTLLSIQFSSIEIKTLCLIRWGKLKIKYKYANGVVCFLDGVKFFVTNEQIAVATEALSWLEILPNKPVQIQRIKRHKAVNVTFEDVPFEKYIICDNLYQGYLTTQSPTLLNEMAKVLYGSPKVVPNDWQRLSIFYWFASLKDSFANTFPHFFKPVNSEPNNLLGASESTVREAMNAQIRALTKGDITKEKEVLSLDTTRALTELDAIARDYEIQQQQMQKYAK